MERNINILLLEDTSSDAALMIHELKSSGLHFSFHIVSGKQDYLSALDQFAPDIILSDYNLPQYDGNKALHDARLRYPDIPFILVTGMIGEEPVIEIFTSGANDYVMKNWLQMLAPAVHRSLEEAWKIRTRRKAEIALRQAYDELEVLFVRRTAELQREIKERKKTEACLRIALSRIKILSGLLPGCAPCKKMCDDHGAWIHVESNINNSASDFAHVICPDCANILSPDKCDHKH